MQLIYHLFRRDTTPQGQRDEATHSLAVRSDTPSASAHLQEYLTQSLLVLIEGDVEVSIAAQPYSLGDPSGDIRSQPRAGTRYSWIQQRFLNEKEKISSA